MCEERERLVAIYLAAINRHAEASKTVPLVEMNHGSPISHRVAPNSWANCLNPQVSGGAVKS
jgi:hypothetical protein